MDTATPDALLDAAACDALGATSPTDAAACQRDLAAADDRTRRTARSLRETVARLSAASPHVAPPAELRGRILQATAPATFKMEDYRKATADTGRFYRWGFYAAMLFLMAGGYYNLSLQGKLKQADSVIVAQAQKVQERDAALRAFVNPNSNEIRLVDKNSGKLYGKALLDENAKTAVVILPEKMIPTNKTVQFSYQSTPYTTILIPAPGDSIAPPAGKSLETALTIKNVEPDSHRVQSASN
jgi:hypothetical protein